MPCLSRRGLYAIALLSFAVTSTAQSWHIGGNYGSTAAEDKACPSWLTPDQCMSGANLDGSSNPSSSASQIAISNRVITVHAVLACFVWVCLAPVGGILARFSSKSSYIGRVHGLLQSLSLVIYLVAVTMGIWLISQLSFGQLSFWKISHIGLGITILGLGVLQSILGAAHYMRREKMLADMGAIRSPKIEETTAGHVHVWLGRALIFAGIINGGLGFGSTAMSSYESNSPTKATAYGIGVGLMSLMYLLALVLSKTRRVTRTWEMNGAVQEQNRDMLLPHQHGIVVDDVILPEYDPRPPPSYDQSEAELTKSAMTAVGYR